MGDEADEANDGNRENAKRASERPTRALIALTLFSALGGFLFGYDTGVMSGAMLLIRKEFKLTTLWQELIVSVAVVAAWFGSLVGGPCADYFGRRKWIMFSSAIFVIGSVTLGAAPTKEALLVGRIIVGLGIGASSMCIPVYISEVAPLSHRGHLTVINSIFLTGGQFVASVVSGLFSGVDKGWRSTRNGSTRVSSAKEQNPTLFSGIFRAAKGIKSLKWKKEIRERVTKNHQ